MRKQELLDTLRSRLRGLPKDDVEERLAFYSEMIDDRVEDGRSEEEAVAEIGPAERIAAEIIESIPFVRIAKERIRPRRRLAAWEIVLLALGAPLWLSLGIALFAVLLSGFAVLWSVIASLWACFAALIGGALGGLLAGVLFAVTGARAAGLATVAAALLCAGLGIFFFFGCRLVTKKAALLSKKMALGIKRCFVRKEEA